MGLFGFFLVRRWRRHRWQLSASGAFITVAGREEEAAGGGGDEDGAAAEGLGLGLGLLLR